MAEAEILHGAPLTPGGRMTLQMLDAFVTEKGYSPNVRELARLCGVSSTSTMWWHLNILRKNGYVTWHDGLPRTIVITGAGIEAMKQ